MVLELTIERANRACDLDSGTRHQVTYLESREACLLKLNRKVTKFEDVGKHYNNGLPCYLFDHRNFGLDDDLDLHLIRFARKDEQLRKLLFEEGWKWNFGADEVKWI